MRSPGPRCSFKSPQILDSHTIQESHNDCSESADRNTFRTLHLRARPERLLRWTLVPAANAILRMVMEIRNEPLNHRPFALRTDAWFAHMRLPYRIAANHGNVFFAWTQSVRQAMPNVIPAMDGKALR